VDVLARVPTGRLVVLGEPGAGKTMLMVRLVLDLLARRVAGGPIPILASLASWNPADQDLRDWLGAQLLIDHSALAAAPPADRQEPSRAAALLTSGLILPILDGLDEIPEEVRGPAISRINDTLRPGEQLVVTCRSQQYRNAVRPPGGVEVTLRAAPAVELRPLDAEAVRGYLCDDAAGPVTKARWDPVLDVLGTDAPAGRALTTPLMVGLARAIYNPRPGELAGGLRDPAELFSLALADRAAVESLLFDAFIPAAYRREPADRWKAQDAERWLVFLARHLEGTIVGPDLAWWQLPLAIPGFSLSLWVVLCVALGIVAGVVAGVALGVVPGILFWAGFGAGGASMATVTKLPKPARGIRWRPPRRGGVVAGAVAGIVVGAVAGIVAGVVAGLGIGRAAGIGLRAGVALGIVAWLATWTADQQGAPLDISSAASPLAVLARDRKAAIVVAIGVGVGVGVGFGAALGISLGIVAGLVTAMASGVATGPAISFNEAAWPSYGIARIWLALHHRLPWSLMGFLADAHRRGVLRQAGAVYQFRHIELQHRLATRPAKSAGVPEAPGSGSAAAPRHSLDRDAGSAG
jgi:NACHT domain